MCPDFDIRLFIFRWRPAHNAVLGMYPIVPLPHILLNAHGAAESDFRDTRESIHWQPAQMQDLVPIAV